MSIVVLASGGGSNFQALLDDPIIREGLVELICNRPEAGCVARAETAQLAHRIVDHTAFDTRDEFDAALADAIDDSGAQYIVMAGFMRILGTAFMQRFEGRMLNIHPSLLPKYKGLNTHQRAIDAGDTEAGVSVHWATAELDGGPLIGQRRVAIAPGDDSSTLAKRVLQQEHELYPAICRALLQNRLSMDGSRTLLDGEPLADLSIF